MGSLLRRSLKNDSVRSGFYLLLGFVLFLLAGQAFCSAIGHSRPAVTQATVRPGTQTPASAPERYVPPAPVEYPFF
jgi:hypothetical protein